MKKFAAAAVVVLSFVALQGVAGARSAPSTVGGFIPSHLVANTSSTGHIQFGCYFFCRSNNLVYHSGGSVEVSGRHDYAIFWGANFPDSKYKNLITGFFTNVGSAGPSGSNVYLNDTQYYQTAGSTTTHIQYSESFAGSWSDTSNPSSSGCSSTAGGSVACVSDAQIQAEVTKAVAANHWPSGLGNEYFVFLGYGISTCSGSSCAFSQFCAYHGDYSSGGQTYIYANMPYTGYNLSACGTGQYPNGSSAGDSTINVTSHEENESITDPLLNAWYDSSGNEIGDKCAWNFGSAQGGSGAEYNQTINGSHYYLQQEWSNATKGCVQS